MHRYAWLVALCPWALAACGGRIADEGDGGTGSDAGKDGATPTKDGGTTLKDGGTTPKDGGVPIPDASPCAFTICGGLCVDTSVDDNNCGQCAHMCPNGTTCQNGSCQCLGGLTLCGSACVDTAVDPLNCGACGLACNTVCVNGNCQPQTKGPPPQGACSHSLCDPNTTAPLVGGCDPTNCVSAICASDSYCCQTAWDSICVGEVATYCAPYACP